MARPKTHTPLKVLQNSQLVGQLVKEPAGGIWFRYDQAWLARERNFAISRALPLAEQTYRGEVVAAVFENLLPDNDRIRKRVAERTGAAGTDAYSLLERIGRDCVGALQFLPEDVDIEPDNSIQGGVLDDAAIERMLSNLDNAPLGMDGNDAFRISVAGAQEKTALLRYQDQWLRPTGTTPTTHILKPQIGTVPTSTGTIDLSNSVDNEHYCLKLMQAFGLPVAKTEIATFGRRRVLVVERFDRLWLKDGRLIRLPQEDCCQALGIPPTLKYQSDRAGGRNGPGAVDILKLLQEADDPHADQIAFLKAQIIFWLIGATDGHGKNFSIGLRPGGGFSLTPFYDVLSVQPAFDAHQIPHNQYKLAMSAGDSRKYAILGITGRHYVETAKEAGMGVTPIRHAISDLVKAAPEAADIALAQMPDDFVQDIHASISKAIQSRAPTLEEALGFV